MDTPGGRGAFNGISFNTASGKLRLTPFSHCDWGPSTGAGGCGSTLFGVFQSFILRRRTVVGTIFVISQEMESHSRSRGGGSCAHPSRGRWRLYLLAVTHTVLQFRWFASSVCVCARFQRSVVFFRVRRHFFCGRIHG